MVTAILLAAGESRRMVRENKLLLPFREKPMVRYMAESILASEAGELIVVTGYQKQQIELALAGLNIRYAYNPDFYSGMASGIRTGVKLATSDSEAVMICLSDMPFLQPMHYNALIRKFNTEKEQGKTPILRPVHKDRIGHPVLFDRDFWPDLLECMDSDGCAPVIQKNEEHFIGYTLANEPYYMDIDTPLDYYKLRE
jgi:molybdenum cofactor cytidylyltransferase